LLRVSQLVIVLALAAPSVLLAADYFGAIAYSTSTGAHGWAKDHPNRAAAQKAARAACSKHAKDCKPVLWFKNGCGALAVSEKIYGWGWGTTQKLADGEALKACAKRGTACKISLQVCTTGAS
jgi:serine/threonine-protein kinase